MAWWRQRPGDVLRGVDLELEPETITCVIAPTGPAVTVLKAISGLLRPTRGTIGTRPAGPSGPLARRVLEAGVVHVPQSAASSR